MKRFVLGLLILASVSCGDMARQGTGSSYLVITSLRGATGDDLRSDVITNGTIFADSASVAFSLVLKDPGGPPLSPANHITVNRYRVKFIRSDGRNTEGVDVPYAFDGAFTITVPGASSANFTLVRAQAKAEAPLGALVNNLLVISTIAQITFYGHDQTGREVLVTGQIGVHFADWAD
ncbi:MAG: hypothetical protein WD227_03310 [Vicinamibacterales bacterium]